jgi:glycosyltransferase involved in cell wall biosynthesis
MIGLISVIVTTYNRVDALDAVLRSLARQTDRKFEVIVADDGSGPTTARLVEAWKPRLGVSLHHVWQEDRGFRAAEARNRAIRASEGGYCLCLDGDCLARPDFVAVHRRLAEPGYFVTGNRVLLSSALSGRILADGLAPEIWGLEQFLPWYWRREVNRIAPLLRVPLGPLRKLGRQDWQGAQSCNVACFRDDLERIDGFDAAFTGWGREDSDLFVRLLRSGIRRKDGRFATGVLHLWHPESKRTGLSDNQAKLDVVLQGHRLCALQGLSSLDADMTAPRGNAG